MLFCFGVLAIQTLILPRFEFNENLEDTWNTDSKWGVKLTVYGHTFRRKQSFPSAMEAEVAVCRDALAMLKRQLPLLTIPDGPTDYPTATTSGWDWVEFLHG